MTIDTSRPITLSLAEISDGLKELHQATLLPVRNERDVRINTGIITIESALARLKAVVAQ